MALDTKSIPSNSNRVDQPTLEAGVYPARVVQIIDLGLQPQSPMAKAKFGEKAPTNEIHVTYELVDTFLVDEDGNDIEDKPRWVSETFSIFSLEADLAKSTKRYRALDPEEVFEGDFSKLLDTPCNVTIVINKKGDKEYENVGNVGGMRPRDAAKCPPLVNEAKFFDLDAPDIAVFNKIPKWLQEKITSNLEYKGSKLDILLGNPTSDEQQEETPKPSRSKKKEEKPAWEDETEDDDVPY